MTESRKSIMAPAIFIITCFVIIWLSVNQSIETYYDPKTKHIVDNLLDYLIISLCPGRIILAYFVLFLLILFLCPKSLRSFSFLMASFLIFIFTFVIGVHLPEERSFYYDFETSAYVICGQLFLSSITVGALVIIFSLISRVVFFVMPVWRKMR